MAAGAVSAYQEGLFRLMRNELNFLTDTIVATLHDNAYTPNAATHLVFTDATNEIADADYAPITLSGKTITKDGSGRTALDADDLNFGDAVSISARWVVVRKSTGTAANDTLLFFLDLNDGGAENVSSTNSDFDVAWNAAGMYRVTP